MKVIEAGFDGHYGSLVEQAHKTSSHCLTFVVTARNCVRCPTASVAKMSRAKSSLKKAGKKKNS